MTTPRVLVSLVGIEKVVPRMVDLAVMLKLLARSATGQPITIYTNIFGGPRTPGEKDGPEEFHLVLIDNGRTRDPRQRGVSRDAALHPLRRVPERVPDLPQDRRPRVRQRLSRARSAR